MIPMKQAAAVSLLTAALGLSLLYPVTGQTPPPVPASVVIAPAWFSVFTQDPTPANGNIRRWVWYGPDDSLAHCLANLTVIMAAAGLGGSAWGYRPYTICYQSASWTTP